MNLRPDYPKFYVGTQQRVNIAGGFITTFTLEIEDFKKFQGISFFMSDLDESQASNNQISPGPLGYKNYEKTVFAVFDLCANRVDGVSTYECAEQEIYIDYSIDNLQPKPVFIVDDDLLTQSNSYDFEIIYIQEQELLTVKIAGQEYFTDSDFNLASLLDDATSAYIGFIGQGTQVNTNAFISNWVVKSKTIDPAKTQIISTDGTVDILQANGGEQFSIDVQTYNECSDTEPSSFGGYNFVSGYFYQTGTYDQAIGPHTQEIGECPDCRRRLTLCSDCTESFVVDKNDGTYSINFRTTIYPAIWSYIIVYGEGCHIEPVYTNGNLIFTRKYNQAVSQSNYDQYCFESESLDAFETTEPENSKIINGDLSNKGEAINLGALLGSLACVLALCTIGILFFMRRRKQWREEKGFIEGGKIINMDKDIEFNELGYSVAANRIQSTTEQILREKALASHMSRDEEIGRLEKEKKLLTEQVRHSKQLLQQDVPIQTENPIPRSTHNKKKKEFSAVQ